MSKHLAVIHRFGCAIELDHPPDKKEIEFVNAVCNSTSLDEGLAILRSAPASLSQDSLKLLASCAAGLWRDFGRPDIARGVSIWALEAARLLSDHHAEASILYMQVGLLLATNLPGEAIEVVKRGRELCSKHPDLGYLADSFAEAERTSRSLAAKASIPEKAACDICGRSFRVHDGGRHIVVSHKHATFTKAAHCFSCSIVTCFGCAEWQYPSDTHDFDQEIAKDIKTPCCPFCKCPIGSPGETPKPVPFLLGSSDHILFADLTSRLHSVLTAEDCDIISTILAASSMKDALKSMRDSLQQMGLDFDARLQDGVAKLKTSDQSELADVLLSLLCAIGWVREKQDTPEIETRDAHEIRPQKEAISGEVIEQQLTRANLLLNQADLSRALNEVKRARQACIKTDDNRRLARSFLIEGLIYQEASRVEDAKRAFEQALSIAQDIGDNLVAAKAHGNLAGCFLEGVMDYERVLYHSQEALSLYRSVGDEIGIAQTLNNIGGVYLKREDPASALPYLGEAHVLKKKHKDWLGAANTIFNIAIAQRDLGNHDQVVDLVNEAVALVRQGGSPLELAHHMYNAASIASEMNDICTAINYYEQSLGLLEKTRAKISDKYLRGNLISKYRAGFHRLARLYLQEHDYGKSVQVLERMAAVGLCEFMTNPGFKDMSTTFPQMEFTAEFPLRPLDESDVWAIARGQVATAVVKYAFVENDLYAFLALPHRSVADWIVHPFPSFGYDALADWFLEPPTSHNPFGGGWFGPLHDLRGAIKGHIFQLEMTKDAFEQFMLERLITAWEPMLLELGRNIFAPLVDYICESGASRILFVPTGVLAQVPLHAMRWKENNQEICVIDRFDVHYSPSLRVYAEAQHRPIFQENNALIIADPGGDLPLARLESRALNTILPSSQLLEGPAATFEQVSRVAPRCGIIHCAAHAIYEPSSASLCGICLAVDQESQSLGEGVFVNSQGVVVSSPVNARYHLATIPHLFDHLYVQPGSLVFLSACDSGSALPDFRGEDYVSLSASFLAAGARAVICAQWPVDSMTATLFSLLFYSHLQSSDSVSALGSAQRELRSITAEQACRLWNSHFSNVEGAIELDISTLGEAIGQSLNREEHPFESAYHWASFGLWGCSSDPVGKKNAI